MQLNQEAASLDWTRSASHTLSGVTNTEIHEEDFIAENSNIPQKLGGHRTDQLISARESSVAAAYHRMANVSANKSGGSEVNQAPDPDYSSFNTSENRDHMISASNEIIAFDMPILVEKTLSSEPDPDDHIIKGMKHEPDPDDSDQGKTVNYDTFFLAILIAELYLIKNLFLAGTLHTQTGDMSSAAVHVSKEPDPDDSESSLKSIAASRGNCYPEMSSLHRHILSRIDIYKPDIDDLEAEKTNLRKGTVCCSIQLDIKLSRDYKPADDVSHAEINEMAEPDPDDDVVAPVPRSSTMQTDEPDPDDQEFQRINDPVTVVCSRLKKALEMLRGEVAPVQSTSIVQTLFKIIRYAYIQED